MATINIRETLKKRTPFSFAHLLITLCHPISVYPQKKTYYKKAEKMRELTPPHPPFQLDH